MKSWRNIALMLAVMINMSAMATTLKLHPDIELIAVDGQKVSSSLLKGADSLELDEDQHQLLFRVVKVVNTAGTSRATYTSPLLLTAFNVQKLDSVTIVLPALDSPKSRESFDKNANYQLLDSRHNLISTRTDRIELSNDDITHRLVDILAQYNAANKSASVPAFVTPKQGKKNWPANPQASSITQDSIDPFLILKYWFRQADKDTQERFMQWAKEKEPQ